MNIGGSIVVLVIAWWIAFQALLPVGVRSPADEGIALPGDPGAPIRGNFLKKGLWAGAIAIVVWGMLFSIVHYSGLSFADIPSLY
jgi:predicted secreted protein